MVTKLRREDIIYPNLSYSVVGALFEVWTNLGPGHREKFYQKALAEELKYRKLNFDKELPAKVRYKDKFIGIYYFDFLIENKIVLELKVRNYFSRKDIDQLFSYLKSKDMKLGIIAHFTKSGVKFKRVVNI
ncbi:GxxExxY protein [Patescibacteria group bacterium]|nr:GxxExxY protein [Patescibacteria group bacterium]